MNGVLRLANNLVIPIARVMSSRGGQRVFVTGKSGAGKTNTKRQLAKAWIENGWPLLAIDPMNNYRALRDVGLPILVAGARSSADLHLTLQNAKELAEFSFHERASIILELSMYEPGEDIAILQAVLQPLWRMFLSQDENVPPQPYAMLIDEAQLFVPQVGITDVTRLINDMGKRGRQLGLSIFFSTQTPTAIQKDFVKQSSLLIVHKVTFGDIATVAEVISQPPKVVSSLMKNFKSGEAIVAGDVELLELNGEDFVTTRIYEWQASGNALTVAMQESSRMRPLNPDKVAQLQETMKRPARRVDDRDAVIEQLRAQVRDLEAEVERLHSSQPETIYEGEFKMERNITHMGLPPNITAAELTEAANQIYQRLRHNGHVPIVVAPSNSNLFERDERTSKLVAPTSSVEPAENVIADPPLLNAGARRILEKLADIYPMLVTRKQIASLTNYTESGGTFQANWATLKRHCFVPDGDGLAFCTDNGFKYLGRQPRTVPNTTAEIMAMWSEVLNTREWEILTMLVNAHPHCMRRNELGDAVGMTWTGGAFNQYIGNLKRNDLIFVDNKEQTVCANGEALQL